LNQQHKGALTDAAAEWAYFPMACNYFPKDAIFLLLLKSDGEKEVCFLKKLLK
jgi:hypothetical protein